MDPLEEAVKLLEECKKQLNLHNEEYHHRTRDHFIKELERFIARHKKTSRRIGV